MRSRRWFGIATLGTFVTVERHVYQRPQHVVDLVPALVERPRHRLHRMLAAERRRVGVVVDLM